MELHYRKKFTLIFFSLLISSCASWKSLEPVTLKYDDFEPPGFFDVGAGFARVINTRGDRESDDDSEGVTLSIKAYPTGRWYGVPLKNLQTNLSAKDLNLISLIHRHNTNGKNIPSNAKDSVTNLLDNPAIRLKHEDRMVLAKAIDEKESLKPEELEKLSELASSKPLSPNLHIIKERGGFWHRFAIFYARSISDFDSGGLKSEVNAIGISFDISPQLAIQYGKGFYEVDDGGGTDSDESEYFGIALNMFAFDIFSAFRNEN